MRQTVHQIEIDAANVGLPQLIGHAGGLFETLQAPNGLLHLLFEILHAQARARYPHVRERKDMLGG